MIAGSIVYDCGSLQLAIPMLREYIAINWVGIKGGVYTYIEKILSRFKGEIVLAVEIDRIVRSPDGVKIVRSTGEIQEFVRASVPEVIELYLPRHQTK